MSARSRAAKSHEEASLPDKAWLSAFRRRLLRWYRAAKRDLPWRGTRDPYLVWVSEVMLQQTQVATVEAYFVRFIERFPTIAALAAAPQQEVLRLWEGLGYYRRARQLHEAAQSVVRDHGGEFPRAVEAVRKLPGIGRYTAGAILSIAFDDPLPILEANTFRLLARLLAYPGDPRSAAASDLFWSFAEHLLPREHLGEFNQALMELGSLVCKPRQPLCSECPVRVQCPTLRDGLVELIPPPLKKPAIEAVDEVAVVVHDGARVLVIRRGVDERWAGLWDFVRFGVPEDKLRDLDAFVIAQVLERSGLRVTFERPLSTIKHGVTRYRITLRTYLARKVGGRLQQPLEARWVDSGELAELPLSVTGRKLAQQWIKEQATAKDLPRQRRLKL